MSLQLQAACQTVFDIRFLSPLSEFRHSNELPNNRSRTVSVLVRKTLIAAQPSPQVSRFSVDCQKAQRAVADRNRERCARNTNRTRERVSFSRKTGSSTRLHDSAIKAGLQTSLDSLMKFLLSGLYEDVESFQCLPSDILRSADFLARKNDRKTVAFRAAK